MAVATDDINNAVQVLGNTGTSTNAITPTLPASLTTDRDRAWVFAAHTHTYGATPSGWTALFKDLAVASSLGAASAGAGQRFLSAFYRDKDASWSTMPSFAMSSVANGTHALWSCSVTKTSTVHTWDTPTYTSTPGNDTTAGTGYSATTGSMTTHAGAILFSLTALNDNASVSSVSAVTQSGIGVNAATYQNNGSATGFDVRGIFAAIEVTTGGTGALTQAMTLAAASQGGTVFIEQNESPPTPGANINTLTEDFSGTNGDPWTTSKWNVVSGTATNASGYGALAAGQVESDALYDLTDSAIKFQHRSGGTIPAEQGSVFILQLGGTLNWVGFTSSGTSMYAFTGVYTTAGTPADMTADRSFRIRHASGTLYWEYSDNDSSWTTMHSISLAADWTLTQTKVSYAVATVSWYIDNINVAATYPPPVYIDSIVDYFNNSTGYDSYVWPDTTTPPTAALGRARFDGAKDLVASNGGQGYSYTGKSFKFQVPGTITSTGSPAGYLDVRLMSLDFAEGASWYFDAAGAQPLGTTNNGSAQAHVAGRWYRIREASGTVYWDYSSDGTSWTNAFSDTLANVYPTATKVFIYIYSDPASGTVSIDVDNVNGIPESTTAVSTVSDNFNTGSTPDAAKWDAGYGSVALSGGEAVFSTTGADAEFGTLSALGGPFTLAGSSAYVQVKSVSLIADGPTFTVPLSLSTADGWGFTWYIWNDAGTVKAYAESGADSAISVITPITHTNGNWYRIRESGGTVYFDYSTDGSSWTNFGSHAVGPTGDSSWSDIARITAVGATLYDFTAGSAQSMHLDNFNVVGGSTGTAAASLQKFLAAAAGAQAQTGTSAASLRSLTAAAAGAQAQSGAAAAVLQKMTVSSGDIVAPQFGVAGSITTGQTSATVNIGVPTGMALNEIALAMIYTDTSSSVTVNTVPSGFFPVSHNPIVVNTDVKLFVYWKRQTSATGSGETTGNYAFGLSASTWRSAWAVRISGVVTTGDPFDDDDGAGSTGSVNYPGLSIDSTVPNDLLVYMAANWDGNGMSVNPSGFTEDADSGNANSGMWIGHKTQASVGSSGTVTAALASGNSGKVAWMGALKGIGVPGVVAQSGAAAVSLRSLAAAASGGMAPSGTSAVSLRSLAAAASGIQTQSGTSAATVRGPVADATGAMQPSGTSASSLRPLTAAASGAQSQLGTSAAALQPLIASASGAMQPSGTGAASLLPLTAAAAGEYSEGGVSTTAVAPLVASAAGAQLLTGTAAGQLSAVAASAVAAQVISGTAVAALRVLTASASGTQVFTGTSAVALRNLAAAASGQQAQFGASAAALRPVLASAAGSQVITGIAVATLRALAAEAAGAQTLTGTSLVALHNLLAAASGQQGQLGVSDAVLWPLIAEASGAQPYIGSSQVVFSALQAAGLGFVVRDNFSALRMLVVTAEDRTLTVVVADRELQVGGEERGVVIAASERVVVVAAEGRELEALAEARDYIINSEDNTLHVTGEARSSLV